MYVVVGATHSGGGFGDARLLELVLEVLPDPAKEDRFEFEGKRGERSSWVVASIDRACERLCEERWELRRFR